MKPLPATIQHAHVQKPFLHQANHSHSGHLDWTYFLRAGVLVLGTIMFLLLLWQASACQHACLTPADCGGLLCGPGRVCVVTCFAGQTDGCPHGTICNNNGNGCVPTSLDGSSSERTPSESTAESATSVEPTQPDTPTVEIPPTDLSPSEK